MEKILNLINGKLVAPTTQEYLPNYCPSTGEIYSEVPDSNHQDVENAVFAAQKAAPQWAALAAPTRAQFLRKIADRIRDLNETLAQAESVDNGKPISVSSSVDIPRSGLNFSFFADAISQFSSEFYTTHSFLYNFTLRQPLGVVGCISPWNLPLYLLSWKIAPALAAGNCVVAKPSEVTPMTAFLLSKIAQDVELPAGVLNIVHGRGSQVGMPLVESPHVRAISFTGSTWTGREIAKAAAPQFKKLSLEMGGKNPTLVFSDCDFETSVRTSVRAAYSNQGEICLCGSRIFVEQSIYEKFKTTFILETERLQLGDPLETSTQQGAIVSKSHYEKILFHLDLAVKEGGRVLTGGKARNPHGRCQNGWFIEPTLIEGLSPFCRTNQEEIFGPVATITPFQTEDEVLNWANCTRYGLSASLWTRDLARAHRISAALQAGMVWVNDWMTRDLRTPFGGTKESGLGSEGGQEVLRFFTEPKTVSIQFGH